MQLAWDVASDLREEGDVKDEDMEAGDEADDYWSAVLRRIKEELKRSGEIGHAAAAAGGLDGYGARKMDEDDDY